MITLKLKGNIIAGLKKSDRTIKTGVAEAVKRASTIIWGTAIKEAPVGASGQLRKSIRRELYPTKAKIYPGVKYAVDVHDGRSPADVQANFGEIWQSARKGGSLHRWAVKRGLNPYAVANAMKKKGTKPNPFFDRTKDKTEDQVAKELDGVLTTLVSRIAEGK